MALFVCQMALFDVLGVWVFRTFLVDVVLESSMLVSECSNL